MEELYMMIINFFVRYGWQMTVCALSGIFLLGVLKISGVFTKLQSKDFRKFLYVAISVALSILACTVYMYIAGSFNIIYIMTIAIPVFAMNQIAYTAYENFGVRAVWKKLLAKIKSQISVLIQSARTAAEKKASEQAASTAARIAAEAAALGMTEEKYIAFRKLIGK